MQPITTLGRDPSFSHTWIQTVGPKDPIWYQASPVVTHHYYKTGVSGGWLGKIVDRWRIVVILVPAGGPDDLWCYQVTYSLQKSHTPENTVEPWWSVQSHHTNHADAMADLERVARQLGWEG